MVSALVVAALAQLGPIQYSGIPMVRGADMVFHRVVFTIKNDRAAVESDSRIHVDGNSNQTVTIDIPRFSQGQYGGSEMMPKATLDKEQIPFRIPISGTRDSESGLDFTGNVLLAPGNHNLHIEYDEAAARTGLGHAQRTFAYAIGKGPQLSRFEMVYHYDQGTVFNVPDMEPTDWPWQTAKTGTYMKKEDLKPNGEVVFFTYYTPKVED